MYVANPTDTNPVKCRRGRTRKVVCVGRGRDSAFRRVDVCILDGFTRVNTDAQILIDGVDYAQAISNQIEVNAKIATRKT